MTREDVIKLKQDAETAQTAADEAKVAAAKAKAEADAMPGDVAKAELAGAAGVAAAQALGKAAEAWRVWTQADHAVPEVGPGDWRVILLGLYLIAMLIGGVYVVSILAMAVPPEKASGAMRTKCCPEGSDCVTLSPAPTPTPTPNGTPTPVPPSSPTSEASPTLSPTARPTAVPTPTKTPVQANAGTNSNSPPGPNNDDAQEILIPSTVCIDTIGRTSADGYLFLVVLFAGMVGAATRLVFAFVRQQGTRDFGMSWVWFYLFTPFSGAAISLFLYYVIRGGFYGSAVGKSLALNVFAFFALGTLSGLFAENAMQKLREVAEVIFVKVPDKSKNTEKERENS